MSLPTTLYVLRKFVSSLLLLIGISFSQHFQRLDKYVCKETTNSEKIQETLFMFQPETGFHTNSWSAFLHRIRKIQNSKYEPDLFKIIDCFIDCHGSVHSD